MTRSKSLSGPSLFSAPQPDMFDNSWEERQAEAQQQLAEYLGMTFESNEARRAYFPQRFHEKPQDPERL